MGTARTLGRAAGVKVSLWLIGALAPVLIFAGLILVVLVVVLVTVVSFFNSSGSTQAAADDPLYCAADEDETEGGAVAPEAEVPEEYQAVVSSAAAQHGISEEILAALIYYESSWNADAVSGAGAQGLGQFMPDTWSYIQDLGIVDSSAAPTDPEAAITAAAGYLAYSRDANQSGLSQASWSFVDDDDELMLAALALAGYNAGPGVPGNFDYDLDAMFSQGSAADPSSYAGQTRPYVENIVAAAGGLSGAFCGVSGDMAHAATEFAWGDQIEVVGGADDVKPEYAAAYNNFGDGPAQWAIDCGTFVSTVVRSTATDMGFPAAGTGLIQSHVLDSDEWETFQPESYGELQPGDIFVATYNTRSGGHAYIYTGTRGQTEQSHDQAVGAALAESWVPSGHTLSLTALVDGTTYYVARPAQGHTTDSETEV